MMTKETIANNAAFRLFLVVVVVLAIMLAFSMSWNREATSTIVTDGQTNTASSVKP